MTTPWLIMPPSGQVIRPVSICGAGIPLGTIAVMAGMEVGTTPGIHLIIMVVGVMAGMIHGSIAIMVGTILGSIPIMVTMDITATPIIMVITTGEVADTIQVAGVAAMPIIVTSALVPFVLTEQPTIVMATQSPIAVVVHPASVTVPVG